MKWLALCAFRRVNMSITRAAYVPATMSVDPHGSTIPR
jgi:hypothetical protein